MTENVTDDEADLEQFLERMTESYLSAIDQNLEAQATFVDSWAESFEKGVSEEQISEGYDGSLRAYEAWMDAAETSFERLGDAVEGGDVGPEEFRDIWLRAANEAFKETMNTTAFAAATGQSIEEALEFQRQIDEASEETLHSLGFATVGDVREVGERLVETERRLHTIETKLDRLLEDR